MTRALILTGAASLALAACGTTPMPDFLPSTDGKPLEFDAGEKICVGNYVAAHLTKAWDVLPQMTTAEKIAFARAQLPEIVRACGLEIDVAALTGSQMVQLVEMGLYYGLATEG